MAMNRRDTLLAIGLGGSLVPLLCGRKSRWVWPLAHAAIIVPSLIRNQSTWGPIVRNVQTSSRDVWLTIDDGPCKSTTPAYLEILDRYDAKATFFMIGTRAERMRPIARQVVANEHGAGSHTHHHWSGAWWGLPPALVRSEIERGHDAVQAATGIRSRHFRCPVGMTNPWVHPVLKSNELLSIGWSASGVDGLGAGGSAVVDRIMRKIAPGGIIVLHESEEGATRRIKTLEMLMQRLASEGWRCVLPRDEQLVRYG